jgi:CheY-like chemotaxis protein
MHKAAGRAAELTKQLLLFSRQQLVEPKVLDLNEVIGGMQKMLERLLGEHIELSCQLDAGLGRILADRGNLEQVIMNLVVNARDAITTGTGRITLETANVVLDEGYCQSHAESTPGEFVTLAVTDTGIGMTPSIRIKLFEPFFTTKPVGQGTGLGLAMCHGIIKQAGGNISVESEPGAGSTFRVYLPRADGEESAPISLGRLSTMRGRETVLLVEDEGMILRVAREALGGLGYRILTASDGVQALDLVSSMAEPVHLLVTDVVMPKMSGRELARRLSQLRPDIRVLFSSGYTENSIVEHGVLDDGVEFLQKPYTPVALARRVREVLDK